MNTELKCCLSSVFPHMDKPNVVSMCRDETPEFNEILEEEVTPETFRCSDAFFWFTADGFMYFFPALIRCSFDNFEKCVPAIEQLLDNFCNYFGSAYDSANITCKWEQFSVVQIKYISSWLLWIDRRYPFYFDETLNQTVEILLLMINAL